jgi:tetratricopeptide (TPR) repeat protein
VKHFNLLNKVLNFSAERYLKTAGDLFIYDGDYETALSMVDKTLEIEPDDTRALVLKGDILFCLNRDLEALQYFNRALKADPNCAEAYISKASVLDILGKQRDALECCKRAYILITRQNEFLLPSLYDQKLSLLVRLRKFREAYQLLMESSNRLGSEEFNYLVTCYKAFIERGCQERSNSKERAQKLALQVIAGQKCQA